MQEALSLARCELGEEAVVLNTRQVKATGLLKFGPPRIEITAAVDDEPSPGSRMVATAEEAATRQPAAVAAYSPVAVAEPPRTLAEPPVLPRDPEIDQLRLELKHLTSVVHGLLNTTSPAAQPKSDRPLLLRLGVDEEIAQKFLPELLTAEDLTSLTAAIASRLQAFAQPPTLEERKVIALVGPTGVGKTTTLAKLAARFALEQGRKVALVTADTFRIGAVEQLRTYARIMGIPLEIALSPDEVRAGVEKHSDREVVLIDTVGRSHRSSDHLRELKAFLDTVGGVENHLVVAASLAGEIQSEVIESFGVFSPSRLIITKLDESPTRGCLLNLPLKSGLGVSCVTMGQNVPQDIQFAEAGALARFVTEVA